MYSFHDVAETGVNRALTSILPPSTRRVKKKNKKNLNPKEKMDGVVLTLLLPPQIYYYIHLIVS